jgi:hypothetical protein
MSNGPKARVAALLPLIQIGVKQFLPGGSVQLGPARHHAIYIEDGGLKVYGR